MLELLTDGSNYDKILPAKEMRDYDINLLFIFIDGKYIATYQRVW